MPDATAVTENWSQENSGLDASGQAAFSPEGSAPEVTGSEESTREPTERLSREELSEGWAEHGRVPRILADIKLGAKTDLGRVRDNNEDKFDFFEPEDAAVLATKGCFYAVADGMGGHSAGQIACEMAIKTVIQAYYANPSSDTESSLRHAITAANGLIFDTAQAIPDRQGMGTTLTAVVVREDRMTIAQVGDSRAYLLRDGAITQLTDDHSWVAEQVRLGTMTLAEAQVSPFRNIITRSIGTAAAVEPDIFTQPLLVGDRLLLCSDGLSGHLEPDEIQSIVLEYSPSVAALSLIETANAHGGRDNITAVILSVRGLSPYTETAGAADPEAAASKPSSVTVETAKEEKRSRWGWPK